jgi:cellulose synthase/poly-beta-1,6-N-acetylglucosamine synthase-like glycosyltransferase
MTAALLIMFILLFLFYLSFLLRIYSGLGKLKMAESSLPDEFISVIIPFRNEEDNILNSIKSIMNQDYPEDKFEVIYVNDSSEDDSLAILMQNIRRENIRVLNLNESGTLSSNKKTAVLYGIEHSRGDIIVTTDADCVHNPSWLTLLLKNFTPDTAMVSGGVRFHPLNNFFDKLQALEFASLVISGAGLTGAGSPIICNGANLAYRKKVFYDLNGFKDNQHLASGDDEFLMQKISRQTDLKISFCIEKNAVVSTNPNSSFSSFFNQRSRWGSKGLFYNHKVMLQLLLIFLFYTSLPFQIILGFSFPVFHITAFSIISLKMLAEYLVLKRGLNLILDKSLIKYFFITELLHLPYIIIMPLAGTFSGFKWKNRKIKRGFNYRNV